MSVRTEYRDGCRVLVAEWMLKGTEFDGNLELTVDDSGPPHFHMAVERTCKTSKMKGMVLCYTRTMHPQ